MRVWQNHAADQHHQSQDCGCNHHAGWGNDEPNVPYFAVLARCAVEGEILHKEPNREGESNPQQAAHESDC